MATQPQRETLDIDEQIVRMEKMIVETQKTLLERQVIPLNTFFQGMAAATALIAAAHFIR